MPMIEFIIGGIVILGVAIYVYHYYPTWFATEANAVVKETDAVIVKANTAVANVVTKVTTSNTVSSN